MGDELFAFVLLAYILFSSLVTFEYISLKKCLFHRVKGIILFRFVHLKMYNSEISVWSSKLKKKLSCLHTVIKKIDFINVSDIYIFADEDFIEV